MIEGVIRLLGDETPLVDRRLRDARLVEQGS